MGCRDYAGRWLASIEGTVAPATLSFYKGTLEAWLGWMKDRASRPLDAVQRADVVEWRRAEAARVTARTANNRLKAVRALFRAAMLEGYAREDPTSGLKALRIDAKEQGKRKRRPFTREELARVLASADETWRLMTLAGLETGQRLGDIARMEWGELDLERAVWRVTTGKSGHGLRIPLSGELVGLLRGRRAGVKDSLTSGSAAGVPQLPAGKVGSAAGVPQLPAGTGPLGTAALPVFPELVEQIGRARGYIGGVSKAFAHLLWQAGLRGHTPYGSGSGKDAGRAEGIGGKDGRRVQHELSFHSLRHTARTWLEEAGQPKAVIDALIGHEGDTGRIYTKVGEESLRVAAETLAGWRKK